MTGKNGAKRCLALLHAVVIDRFSSDVVSLPEYVTEGIKHHNHLVNTHAPPDNLSYWEHAKAQVLYPDKAPFVYSLLFGEGVLIDTLLLSSLGFTFLVNKSFIKKFSHDERYSWTMINWIKIGKLFGDMEQGYCGL
ncbi:hypothetical protein K7X08_027054 [Anisodus acutangulus]|uniref:Uncharacterized protein n=1 Tax=Anisodus acutangulus TaxID=402998 RepID=A0A9Q1RKL8_9SOLA|nr:hypothetical protein K7X08_027054 [Anisodus acutangulus]